MIGSLPDDPIRVYLAARCAAGAFPGAVWRVDGTDGPLHEGRVGFEDAQRGVAARLETVYDLASLTKPLVTALILLLLDREGTIDLAAPVRTLLPELEGSPYGDASFLDLGSHRGGLPAWRPLYLHASDLEGYLRVIAREPPAVPRGTTLYSDLGFILLGAAIERAERATLDRAFETRVATPLGLRSTGFGGLSQRFAGAAPTEVGSAYEKRLAGDAGRSYAWRIERARGEVHDENARVLGGVAGHAGLFGTCGDVALLGREMLWPRALPIGPPQQGLLLYPWAGSSSRTFGLMTAGESETLRGVLPDGAVGHFGFTGTSLWLDPAAGRVYVFLTNRVHPSVPSEEFTEIRREFHAIASR